MEIAALADCFKEADWFLMSRCPSAHASTFVMRSTRLWVLEKLGLVWTDLEVWVYLGWTLGRRERG